MKSKNGKSILLILVIVVIGLWLLTGIYTVSDTGGEQAVLLRFGKFVNTEKNAGLHWHLPLPIESVIKVKVEELRTIEIGIITERAPSSTQRGVYTEVIAESLMLTKEEAMLKVSVSIKYKIDDIFNYLFKVDDQEGTLKVASQSVVRRVIASHNLDETIATNKSGIQNEIYEDLQEICDTYEIGISIEQVKLQDVAAPEAVQEAFKDVTDAKADRDSFINEAEAYKAEIIPTADGNAIELLNEAIAYKSKRIAEALGDVARFSAILKEYKLAEEVTKVRLYIEMMEEVLPNMKKFIVNEGSGIVKFLPLENSDTKILPISQDGGITNE